MGLLDGIRRRGIRRLGVRFGHGRRDTGRVPAPFVVGIARSGTTLLRLMLDAHPQLTIPPETHFLPGCSRTSTAGSRRESRAPSFASERWS